MSCSTEKSVQFVNEIEEIPRKDLVESNSNSPKKKNLIFSERGTNMSSIDSELSKYTYFVSNIVKQLKEIKEENEKLKKQNKKLKKEVKNQKEINNRLITENSDKVNLKLQKENDKLKEENEELKSYTFSEDIRGNNITIKMNEGWLYEYVWPVLESRDQMKEYFEELEDLGDDLSWDVDFKDSHSETRFYENLVGEIQARLNSLKIFGGVHTSNYLEEMIPETITEFIQEALSSGEYFEIECEEEEESEEESDDSDEEPDN